MSSSSKWFSAYFLALNSPYTPAASSSRVARLEVWSSSKIDPTTGTPGVRIPTHAVCLVTQFVLYSDVEIHHLEKRTELEFGKISIVSEGPLRGTVSTEIKYGQSTIRVEVSVYPVSRCCAAHDLYHHPDIARRHWRYAVCIFSHIFMLINRAATTNKDSRSFLRFDANVDWHQRHEFLKCTSSDNLPFDLPDECS
jgi:hypothetical protein